jgi:two-component system, sensor histidine kinase and response regulator
VKDIKILLVEDDRMLQFVFKRQMQRLGFLVADVADDGKAAVEKMAAGKFDIVFMDVALPGMDGIEATALIRKAESDKRTPIVGLTAYGERQLCLNAGMDDFLQKPVALEELSEAIFKWTNAEKRAPLRDKPLGNFLVE